MTPHEERTIIQWNKNPSGKAHLILNITDDKRSEDLRLFCRELGAFASNVEIEEQELCTGELPSIQVGDNIHYSGVPLGLELQPFLQAISSLNNGEMHLSGSIQEQINKIESPQTLKLYIIIITIKT